MVEFDTEAALPHFTHVCCSVEGGASKSDGTVSCTRWMFALVGGYYFSLSPEEVQLSHIGILHWVKSYPVVIIFRAPKSCDCRIRCFAQDECLLSGYCFFFWRRRDGPIEWRCLAQEEYIFLSVVIIFFYFSLEAIRDVTVAYNS